MRKLYFMDSESNFNIPRIDMQALSYGHTIRISAQDRLTSILTEWNLRPSHLSGNGQMH